MSIIQKQFFFRIFVLAFVACACLPVQEAKGDGDLKAGKADTVIARSSQLPTLKLFAATGNQAGARGTGADSLSAHAYIRPFSKLFKYNTTWSNPEHRCYEFRQPLTAKQTFLFNFMSSRKYDIDVIKPSQ